MKILLVSLLIASTAFAQVPSSTPPMGYNTWFEYFQTPTEAEVKTQANALISTGLTAKGYNLISIDAGWSQRPSGLLVANVTNFPDGMPALVSYIHGQGQFIGLYSTPGPEQCDSAGPGSYTYEATDAATFASWGIDYLKYDFCTGASEYANTTAGVKSAYQVMGTAIAGSSNPNMYYLVSQPELTYGYGNAWTWFSTVGGNEYWTVEIAASNNLDAAEFATPWAIYQPYQSKGHWLNDDYLICGQYTIYISGGTQTVTDVDCATQFNLFAMLASPLIVSADVTSFNATVLGILGNTEVIAVDQDSLGLMGNVVSNAVCGSSYCPVWARKLANGNIAVALFNRDAAAHNVSLTFTQLNSGHTTYNVRDIVAHSNLGSMTSYTATSVAAHGSAMVVLSAGSGSSGTGTQITNGKVLNAVIQ